MIAAAGLCIFTGGHIIVLERKILERTVLDHFRIDTTVGSIVDIFIKQTEESIAYFYGFIFAVYGQGIWCK